MTEIKRICELFGGIKTRNVSHVEHELRAHAVRNLAHALDVPVTAIGTGTADEHLWHEKIGQRLHIVIVDDASVGLYLVGQDSKYTDVTVPAELWPMY